MIVTSLSALAVSVRSTLTGGRSKAGTNAPEAPRASSKPAPATDTVELSKHSAVRFHRLSPTNARGIEKRDERRTNRLEDVFAHVDRNRDGTIDATELTSALPAPDPSRYPDFKFVSRLPIKTP